MPTYGRFGCHPDKDDIFREYPPQFNNLTPRLSRRRGYPDSVLFVYRAIILTSINRTLSDSASMFEISGASHCRFTLFRRFMACQTVSTGSLVGATNFLHG